MFLKKETRDRGARALYKNISRLDKTHGHVLI